MKLQQQETLHCNSKKYLFLKWYATFYIDHEVYITLIKSYILVHFSYDFALETRYFYQVSVNYPLFNKGMFSF